MSDEIIQYTTAVIRVGAVIGLFITAIGFKRWSLLVLAGFLAAHTGLYIALLAGVELGTWTVTVGGALATGIAITCVAAALASAGNSERVHALLESLGARDPEESKWKP